jgi:hypothetical protein
VVSGSDHRGSHDSVPKNKMCQATGFAPNPNRQVGGHNHLVCSLNQREQNGENLCLKWVGLLELARTLFAKASEDSLRASPATWPKWAEVV